jgi:gliding motility-associated-like protein
MKISSQIRIFLAITFVGISQILFAQQCPTISNITSSTAVCAGGNIALEVTATSPDASALTYAWFKNGTAIQNATSSRYEITNFQFANADVYFVKVSNACNTPTKSANVTLTLKDKPSINSLSSSPQTVCSGTNYTIQVSGNDNGGGTITYQWKRAGSNIANATASSYALANIQSGDAALYSVVLSNGCGNVTSSDFQLIVNQKPSITLNPAANSVLCAGATLTLNADVITATSYKWQKDGVDIGNTSKTVSIPSVAASDAGVYTFVATNSCGTSTSGTAQVTIKDKPSITSITAPTNVCAGSTASLVAAVVANGDNNLTYAWSHNGTAVTNGNNSTLVVPNFQSANAGTYSFTVTNSCGTTSSATNNQNVSIQLITTPSITTITDRSVCLNTSLLVSTTITNLGSTSPTYQWYFNGSAISGQTGAQLNISNIQSSQAGRYYVTVNNGCSSTISSNEFNVSVLNLPTIQTQPTAQTEACTTTSFTLSVAANNTQTYQWYKNDVAINTATASSFNIPSVASSDAATYKVVVSNSCGFNVTSNAAVLVVKSAPTVQTNASTNTLCVGASHTLQVTAVTNNGGTLTYQWKKGGVNIPNATTASLALNNLQTGDAGVYTVAVTNSCGTTTSPDYTITMTQAPIITLDPVSQSLCAGATATFTANVTGSTSVKWQRNGVDVGNTTTTLSIPSVATANAGTYTFLATNSCGTTTSAAATLAVNNKPVINSLTTTSPVCAGNTATITAAVSANGDNNLTYSWSLGGTIISGANTNVLSIPNFQSANAGSYALVVTNSCGASTGSSTTTLQLQPTPAVANINDVTVCQAGTLNVAPVYTNVSGSTVTYQWYFDGNVINGQTGAQLNISNIQSSQAGRYYVAVNNGCSPVSSAAFNVSVLNLPTIQTQPAAQTEACIGTNFSLSVKANNAQTYQWYKNNVAIAGETTSTYTKSVSAQDVGTYKVAIANGCGYNINSNNAILTVKSPPTVTSSPTNTTVCVGQPISASVIATANGGGNLRYIWTSGGTEVAGATSANFTIARATTAENGKVYSVSVLNDCNIPVNGGSFTVTVGDKPTVAISTSIPMNTTANKPTVCLGSPISFLVTSESNGYSPSYTWFKDDISKGTSSSNSLNVNSSTTADAGTYKLSVSNTCGAVTSNAITIGVHEKPIIATNPEATITACELTNVTLSAVAQNKPGTNSDITYTWYYNNNPATSNGANLTLTNVKTDETGNYQLRVSNECGVSASSNAVLTVVSKPKYSIITPSSEFAICSATNQTKTLSVNIFTVNGQTPSIVWSTSDGSITGFNTVGNTANVTIASVGKDATYTAELSNACGTTVLKTGAADGITIKNEARTPIVNTYTIPPFTTFCEGDQIKLNITTRSSAAETYIWKLNNVVVATLQSGNLNSSDYTRYNATAAHQGTYSVDITNKCGTLANAVSIPVTVNPTPVIAFDVSSATTQCLSNNLFNFTNNTVVTGGSTISYTWEFGDGGLNTTAINSTSRTYANSGTYNVTLSGINNYGCKNSKTKEIIVAAEPRITKQPSGGIICQGTSHDLISDVNPGGAGSLSYQWYFNNQPISNSNNLKYTISSMSAANAGTYYLKVTNAQCNLFAQTETVTVSYQEKPNASFNIGGKSFNACVNDAEYTFMNTTPPLANVSYLWSTSDGGTSRETNFTHKFTNTGVYDITLTATVGGCSSGAVSPLGNTNNRIRVNGLPTITKDLDPTKTINRGTALVLSVEATSLKADGTAAPATYSWYKMPSTTVIGSNAAIFNAITNAVISDTGRYYVNVANACGIVRSNISTIKVYDKPTITLQPVATKACKDKPLQLTVNAISNDNTSPLYQWYYQQDLNKTAVVVPGANGPVLNIPKFESSNAGHYYVTLTNSIETTTSDKVIVTINDVPQINSVVTTPSIESGICINTPLQLNATVSNLANSTNTISWEQNGVTIPGQSELQLNFAAISKANHGDLILKVANACGTASKTMSIKVIDLPVFTQSPVAVTTCVNGVANFTAKVQAATDGTPFGFQWLRNGAVYTGTGIISDEKLALSNVLAADAGYYALQASNACGIVTSATGKLTVIAAGPTITQQPTAINTCAGTQNTVSIVATSEDNTLSYSWYKNGIAITNEVTSQLLFNTIATSDAGTYKAVVTNGCGLTTTSNNFIVVVKEKVTLNGSIANKQLCVGNALDVDLSAYLTGGDVSSRYQWRLNSIDITEASAKTTRLQLLNVAKTNQGSYSLIATNGCGPSTLNLFSLSINTAPEITTQPVVGFVCEGKTFTNNVIAANATQLPLSYQWFKDGNSIANNATAQQLVLQNIGAADQGLYAVRVSNACGTTQSTSARLSLIGNPLITQQPASITSCAGIENSATIVGASDDNALVYKWYKDGILLADQISNQLVFTKISATNIGSYKSVITNSCGLSATSNIFQVVVNDKVKLSESIANKVVCVGSDFETDLSSNLKGADLSSRYQWKLNGIDVVSTSAKTNKIQLLNVTKSNSGKYSILATNNCGAAIIDLFNLDITNLPVIETHPIEGSICENLDWTNKVVTSNADQIGFTYQWFKDGVALSGANQPILYVANTVLSNKGLYSVKLSSACGEVMSQSALLQVRPTPQIDIALVGTPPMQCIDNNTFTFKPNIFISDNSLVDLTWDFGNGVTSKQSQVSHSYDFANDFNVYLFAKSIYGCKDTATQVVSVNTKPIITGNIVNQILCTGSQLNYNVDVKVKPNEKIGYQWYFNQEPILNAVNKSITLDNVQKVNGGNYKLRITNACGITYSTEAELKIAEKPLVTVPLPVNYKVCENTEIVLKPTIYSILPNSFQWYKNELPFVGRESDTLRIKQFGTQDVATYSVSIANKCGTTFAVPGNLIMKNIPWSTQTLLSDTICYETNTKLTLKDFANNDDTLMFSWFKNGEQILGVNTKEYVINKFIINDTGYYAAKLSNSCGTLNVPVAKLTLNKINAAFSLDTLDACKGSLIINGLDTTRSLFRIRDNYWQIKELNKTLGSTPGMRFQFPNSGTYTVRHAVTDMKGCNSDTVSKTVINYGKPTASFTINDTCMTMPTIALNNSVFGYASTKLTKYTWNFGDTTIIRNTSVVPAYTYKTAGPKTLQLIVESDSSCVADTLSKKLMVYGNPVASFVTQDSCQGFPVLFTNKSFTQFAPDSVVRFSWNFDDGSTSTLTNPQNIFKQYGAYKIKLTAYSASCPFLTDDTTINMTIKIPRANQVYPRIQTVKRVIGQMNAVGNGRSYTWLPFTGLTDTKIKNPKFSIIEDKLTYNITIVDSAGCVNTDKQEVWAFNKPDIYLATGFSPNNDGVNDKYKPEYIEIKILEYFRVQDSNNRQVFITNSLTDKWDGTYNGNPLPPAPYLVTVAGIDILGNRIVKQGIVLVVK